MQLSEEKRQSRNKIIAAFEKHGIDYQLPMMSQILVINQLMK